jgi:CheY-like chemotaxis protein
VSTMTLEEGSKVLVVDDDARDAKSMTHPLSDAGFQTSVISYFDPKQDADSFLAQLGDRYDALVCDHVLSGRSTVRFTGAELVSKANRRARRPLPAVLISSHVQTDQTGSIRRWREGIPVVLEKSDLSETIVEALDFTVDELSGKVSRERRAFATPIEILEVLPSGEVPTAKVIVVGWRIATSVWMPLQPILDATGLDSTELPGRWLEAEVNCHATDASDLYYRNITLAPDLPKGWQ